MGVTTMRDATVRRMHARERRAVSTAPDPRAGDRLVGVGAVVFVVGLLATLVTLVPFFLNTEPMPTSVYLIAMLTPVGLGLALAGILRSARAESRSRRHR
jgi:hypothetical protein